MCVCAREPAVLRSDSDSSVGRDVMVGLRRTQESQSLLVLPLLSHLRKETVREKDELK